MKGCSECWQCQPITLPGIEVLTFYWLEGKYLGDLELHWTAEPSDRIEPLTKPHGSFIPEFDGCSNWNICPLLHSSSLYPFLPVKTHDKNTLVLKYFVASNFKLMIIFCVLLCLQSLIIYYKMINNNTI